MRYQFHRCGEKIEIDVRLFDNANIYTTFKKKNSKVENIK